MEERKARNWYWWLWLSPLVTIPTLTILMLMFSLFYGPGRGLICIAVLGSALWHLILLFPALNKKSEFVRWHGRQALFLAGVRTAVPLVFGLVFGAEDEALLFIPVLIAVWFFGTLWGQLQAARGKCSLMRWFGRAEALSSRVRAEEPAQIPTQTEKLDPEVEALVDIIRFSRDPHQRGKALRELQQRGMVEPL